MLHDVGEHFHLSLAWAISLGSFRGKTSLGISGKWALGSGKSIVRWQSRQYLHLCLAGGGISGKKWQKKVEMRVNLWWVFLLLQPPLEV
jgi:hypothetical protein